MVSKSIFAPPLEVMQKYINLYVIMFHEQSISCEQTSEIYICKQIDAS